MILDLFVLFCLILAGTSALPQYSNSGYAYPSGNSGGVSNQQLGYNYQPTSYGQHSQTVHQQSSSYSQAQQPYVSVPKYVEPPVSQHGGHGLVSVGHGSISGGHGLISGGHGSISGGHGIISGGHGSISGGHGLVSGGHGGTNFLGFPDAPPAALVGAEYVQTSSGNNFVEEHHGVHGAPLITKSFYTFSGPEDHQEKTAVHHITIGKPQKHYRIIFIKNPSSSVNRALIKAHLAPNEEKTVVYVLSKNENELDIQSEIDEPAINQPSKPDVVFVKYKNPEEIAHLQATVQEQYNTIPGENLVAGEEHAPVRSVIGSLGGGNDSYHSGGGHSGGGHSGTVTVSTGEHTGHGTYTNGGHTGQGSNTNGGHTSHGAHTHGGGHGHGAGNLNSLLANIAYLPPTSK